jgi:GGDEF domain-containing protein
LSNAAVIVSVAAVALLFVALAATLVIAWRRRRADRAAISKAGTAAGAAASSASLSPAVRPGSAAIAAGSPTAGVASGPDATPLAAAGPGAWMVPWPVDSEKWGRMLRHEDDRLARYPHRVAVAIAELDGVDIVVDRYGRPAEERLARAVEDTLRRCARETDVVARIERRRFAVLLVETDDAGAERYAHRLRLATDLWLEAVALPLRMRVAVAGPPIGGTLAAALEIAESRLATERAMLDHEHDSHEALHPTGRRSPGGVR